MSKGLEALKRMGEFHNERHFTLKTDNGDNMAWSFNTVKELFPNEFETIEKELKSLEIIKEKVKIEFNDHYFGFANNYYIIVNNGVLNPIKVTKEEYDLLKEGLL